MPWQRSVLMDERMKFIGRLLYGDKMTEACREFGISRKTGYKFWNRYKDIGLHGLNDRIRKPTRYATINCRCKLQKKSCVSKQKGRPGRS